MSRPKQTHYIHDFLDCHKKNFPGPENMCSKKLTHMKPLKNMFLSVAMSCYSLSSDRKLWIYLYAMATDRMR